MKKQSKPKFESIFVLRVYIYGTYGEKPTYQIDKDELKRAGSARPGVDIWCVETGYFRTLREAETRVRRIAGEVNTERWCKLYSFVVEEKPLGCMIGKGDYLTVRRYLKDGSLWQVSKVSCIRRHDDQGEDLGNTGFYGRDLRTIPIKEGDIVEIAGERFVELGIVWQMPPTKERMKVIWKRYRKTFGKIPRVHPDDTDDSYSIVYYDMDKDGEIGYSHYHPAVVNVMPPSLPVPKKYALQLRKCLKTLQKEAEEYARNWEKEQQKKGYIK